MPGNFKRVKRFAARCFVPVLLIGGILVSEGVMAQGGSTRQYDEAVLAEGRAIFQQHCAACHGVDAEGQVENWQVRDKNGKLPAPPLNGTAHTWHHPTRVLFRIIRDGTGALGGNMPAWGDTLNSDEILTVILWITSLWPDEVYDVWLEQSRQQGS